MESMLLASRTRLVLQAVHEVVGSVSRSTSPAEHASQSNAFMAGALKLPRSHPAPLPPGVVLAAAKGRAVGEQLACPRGRTSGCVRAAFGARRCGSCVLLFHSCTTVRVVPSLGEQLSLPAP